MFEVHNLLFFRNPTPIQSDLVPLKWEPVTKNQTTTMIIDDDLRLEKDIWKSRMDLWDELYAKYLG